MSVQCLRGFIDGAGELDLASLRTLLTAAVDFAGVQFSELIWQPMGAEFDAYVTIDPLGGPRTAGGICTTLRDLARFGQVMLESGRGGTETLVPRTWIDDTLGNVDRGAWRAGESLGFLPDGGYRIKWWIIGDAHNAYAGIGVYGQWLYVNPKAEVVIAVFSSQPLPLDDNVSSDSLRCFEAIVEALS